MYGRPAGRPRDLDDITSAKERRFTRRDAGGAIHDPPAALVFCQPAGVDLSVINGRVRIEEGRLLNIELDTLIERHNAIARALVRGESG